MRTAVLLLCLLAGAAKVYPEAPVATASRTTEMARPRGIGQNETLITLDQVDEWVRRWQKRLGLEEWKIEARVVRLSQLPKGTIANIHWSLPRKHATIKVLDSVDSNLPKGEIARDTELSVVHELVHLSMAKLPLDSNNTELEEETVKRISSALLALEKRDD